MTKQEAISKMETFLLCCQITGDTEMIPAIRIAIDALKGHYTEQEVRDAFGEGYHCGMEDNKRILYICDKERDCVNPSCKSSIGDKCYLTRDIEHAVNFKLEHGVYVEKGEQHG